MYALLISLQNETRVSFNVNILYEYCDPQEYYDMPLEDAFKMLTYMNYAFTPSEK